MKTMYLSLSDSTIGYAVFQDDEKIVSGVLADNGKSNDPTEVLCMVESLLRAHEPQTVISLNNSKARYLLGGIHLLCCMFSIDSLLGPPKGQLEEFVPQLKKDQQEAYALALHTATFGGQLFVQRTTTL